MPKLSCPCLAGRPPSGAPGPYRGLGSAPVERDISEGGVGSRQIRPGRIRGYADSAADDLSNPIHRQSLQRDEACGHGEQLDHPFPRLLLLALEPQPAPGLLPRRVASRAGRDGGRCAMEGNATRPRGVFRGNAIRLASVPRIPRLVRGEPLDALAAPHAPSGKSPDCRSGPPRFPCNWSRCCARMPGFAMGSPFWMVMRNPPGPSTLIFYWYLHIPL